jgi:hypothetical protein
LDGRKTKRSYELRIQLCHYHRDRFNTAGCNTSDRPAAHDVCRRNVKTAIVYPRFSSSPVLNKIFG